jgi:ribosomal protein L11 methylase PrmA
MKSEYNIESSSFRDNLGNVYNYQNRILRSVNTFGKLNYEFLKSSNILDDSIKLKYLIETKELKKDKTPDFLMKFEYVLESKVIPFVTYPYEWTFEQLKKAALHHLDFQIFLLNKDAVLRDASAYNIQFIGSEPIFIDVLSIKKYDEGEYWLGYKQFCENFLNPLILGYKKGVYHNDWFRGSLEGIDTKEINKLLNLKDKLSYKIFFHTFLQSKLIDKTLNKPSETKKKIQSLKKYSRLSYLGILNQLRSWISKIEFKKDKSIWENYSKEHTYRDNEFDKKKEIVGNFINKVKPKKLIDLGCNTGDFSILSLDSGAENVVGFDFDHNAITEAYLKSSKKKLKFLPLVFNAVNPSPNQGWMQIERKGFMERFKSDTLIALAFEHHLIIGKNIPMNQFFDWISKISKNGLLEFIPKRDPTIQKMLEYRDDIFDYYSEENFEINLKKISKINNKTKITDSGRVLYEYEIQ